MVDETTTTNEPLTADEIEALKAQLEAEIKAKNEFEALIGSKDAEIATLNTEVSRLTQDLEALKTQTESLRAERSNLQAETASLRSSLDSAVAKYRDLVVGSNPHLADFIQGASIDEIDTSVENAKALVEKVKQAIELETQKATVPAGAPVRTATPPEGMSPREKIVYGITQKGR